MTYRTTGSRSPVRLAATCAAFLLLACGGDGGTGPDDDPEGTVSPAGGTVQLAGGAVAVVVPAGAVASNIQLTAEPAGAAPASPMAVSGSAFDMGPDGTQFATPVTLTLDYDPGAVPAGVAENELRLFLATGGGWQLVAGSSVNAGANTVSGPVSHFSVYGVLGLAVDAVAVAPQGPTVELGSTLQLSATPAGSGVDLPSRSVTWSSSNGGVATVSSTGQVTGTGEGTAVITATSDGANGTTTVTVAIPVVAVNVAPTTATVGVGQTTPLTASVRGPNGTVLDRPVAWTSSATGVATVNASGLVTGVAAGTATITATSQGVTGTATVTVSDPVATVLVAPASATVDAGATTQLTATLTNASGTVLTGRTVTWGSSNTAVATVDANGLVTAVATGMATITATSEGQSGTATIIVPIDFTAFAGTYSGMWNNTTFGSSGAISVVISVDTNAQTMTVTTDVDGNVFGQADPAPSTRTISYANFTGSLSFSSPTFGDVTYTLSGNTYTSVAENIPAAGIDRMEMSGTFAQDGSSSGTYTIYFTGGGSAQGTVTLNRQ